jgi:capsular exopolysaccharide synthesis family protein
MKDVIDIEGGEFIASDEELFHRTKEVDIITSLRRRWRLVAGLVTGCCLVTYLALELMTPLYEAKTSVMIDPREPKPSASRTDQKAEPPSEETLRKNEIAILRSRGLIEAVVARLSLEREPESDLVRQSNSGVRELLVGAAAAIARAVSAVLGRSRLEQNDIVDALLNRLNTVSTDASRVIEIRFRSADPVRAALIVNTIADEYIAHKMQLEVAGAKSTVKGLEEDIQTLNRKIREAELVIGEIRYKNGLVPSGNNKILLEQLSELNKQIAAATTERAGAEGRLAELSSVRGAQKSGSAGSVLGSPVIQRLEGEADLLAAKIGEMSTFYGDSHPTTIQARAQLKNLRSRIDAEVDKIAEADRRAMFAAKAKETTLKQEMDWLKERVTKENPSEADVRALEREADGYRTLLTQLIARLNDTKTQIQLQGPEAWVLSRATIPIRPSFPPRLAMLSAAFFISAAGGAILAAFLERRDTSIRSMAQLRQLTSMCVLAAIPIVNSGRKEQRSPQSHVLAQRRSLFVEQLRALWFGIQRSPTTPGKVLLITSSVTGEGKSCIASSLARLLALEGRRVVIIDADLRNPSVHRKLGMTLAPGLTEIIAEERDLDEVLKIDAASGSHVLTAGAPVASPSDILQSPRLQSVVRRLAVEFDTVIMDSPPVLAVHDAFILATLADTTIMVVRWGATKLQTFITALHRMAELDVATAGVVLSMVDGKRYANYGYPDSEIFSRTFRRYHTDITSSGTKGKLISLRRDF